MGLHYLSRGSAIRSSGAVDSECTEKAPCTFGYKPGGNKSRSMKEMCNRLQRHAKQPGFR